MRTADIPNNLDRPASLKVKLKVIKEGKDPSGLSRWDVFAKRFLIIEIMIGTVFAASREEALAKAKNDYPQERRISVSPSTND